VPATGSTSWPPWLVGVEWHSDPAASVGGAARGAGRRLEPCDNDEGIGLAMG